MFRCINSKNSINPNSFDLLRLVAAILVVVSHQCLLLGHSLPYFFWPFDLGYLALLIFFALSGGLITQSWQRDPQARKFLLKRCLRIFPALVVVVTLTALVLGPAFTALPVSAYFSDVGTWKYFRCILLWPGHSYLPGVFTANPYPNAVNGSLWTLPMEFACYLSVLAVGITGLLRRAYTVSVLMFGFSILAALTGDSSNANLKSLTLLTATFWWGAWLWLGFAAGYPRRKIDQLLAVLALTIVALVGSCGVARAVSIALAVGLVWLAARLNFGDRITRRLGDLSYGVYIFGFPVQQCLVAKFGPENFSYLEFLALSLSLILPLAWCSWHLVEKYFLRMKKAALNSPKLSNN